MILRVFVSPWLVGVKTALIQIEIAHRLGDGFFLRLAQRFLEPA